MAKGSSGKPKKTAHGKKAKIAVISPAHDSSVLPWSAVATKPSAYISMMSNAIGLILLVCTLYLCRITPAASLVGRRVVLSKRVNPGLNSGSHTQATY